MFSVVYREVGATSFTTAATEVTGTTYTLTQLTPDTTYEIAVLTSNNNGAGPVATSSLVPKVFISLFSFSPFFIFLNLFLHFLFLLFISEYSLNRRLFVQQQTPRRPRTIG
jgi:hypothetical protein